MHRGPEAPQGENWTRMMSERTLLSLREAADRSGVSASRLRRLAANGTLQAAKAGSYWVVTERALDAFIRLERPRGVKAAARQAPGRQR